MNRRSSISAIAALLAVLALLPAAAGSDKPDPAYLQELPAVEQLMTDMKIDDPHMTDARQAAALSVLAEFLGDMAGPRADRNEFTADEKRLLAAYGQASQKLRDAHADGMGENLAFLGLTVRMLESDKFRDSLLKKYLSADTLAAYAKIAADNKARRKSAPPATAPAAAPLDPPYLREMPSVEEVMKDMEVKGDPDRTAARRANAFDELWNVIATIAGTRGPDAKLTADESRIWNQYSDAGHKIAKTFTTQSARVAFGKLTKDAANQVHDEIFELYFSVELCAQYDKAKAAAEK